MILTSIRSSRFNRRVIKACENVVSPEQLMQLFSAKGNRVEKKNLFSRVFSFFEKKKGFKFFIRKKLIGFSFRFVSWALIFLKKKKRWKKRVRGNATNFIGSFCFVLFILLLIII